MISYWKWEPCSHTNAKGTYCTNCGADRPPEAEILPPAKLVFCDKKPCGCYYLDHCPTHEEKEPDTKPGGFTVSPVANYIFK